MRKNRFKKAFMIASMVATSILSGVGGQAFAKQPKKIVVSAKEVQLAHERSDELTNNPDHIEKLTEHLAPDEKKEFLDVYKLLPQTFKLTTITGILSGRDIWRYIEFSSDKSGYKCVRKMSKNLNREQAIKVQKMCLEILTYGKPLIILGAENDTLEQIIDRCHLAFVRRYRNHPEDEKKWMGGKAVALEMGFYRNANAMIGLGEAYHHPEWIQLGKDMLAHSQPLKKLIKKKAIFDREFVCPACVAGNARTRQ